MKIYLAAQYERHDEMRGVRDVLQALGHQVTSRWIDQHGGDALEAATADQLDKEPEKCAKFALADIEDLEAADTVMSFTRPGGGGRGGRHVEFGYAIRGGKRLVLVGPREHVFHTLPQVEHYPDWPHLVMALSGSSAARCR